mmetsp:Transcript_45371/g.107108  ORF Transcript_45371/g.107108 Transcript_45371/m.107108 type:complete len:225 (+) Transcript_45371:177-851(+)
MAELVAAGVMEEGRDIVPELQKGNKDYAIRVLHNQLMWREREHKKSTNEAREFGVQLQDAQNVAASAKKKYFALKQENKELRDHLSRVEQALASRPREPDAEGPAPTSAPEQPEPSDDDPDSTAEPAPKRSRPCQSLTAIASKQKLDRFSLLRSTSAPASRPLDNFCDTNTLVRKGPDGMGGIATALAPSQRKPASLFNKAQNIARRKATGIGPGLEAFMIPRR